MHTHISPIVLALAALSTPLIAQQTLEAPPPSMDLVFAHDSGQAANNTGLAQVVISFPVVVQGSPWMRLYFSDVQLAGDPDAGTGSILRMTSLYDAEVQELDARGVLTNGGRVLAVTARARTVAEARAKAYANAERIRFVDRQYRRDIAAVVIR